MDSMLTISEACLRIFVATCDLYAKISPAGQKAVLRDFGQAVQIINRSEPEFDTQAHSVLLRSWQALAQRYALEVGGS